jgi:hypothetical protein
VLIRVSRKYLLVDFIVAIHDYGPCFVKSNEARAVIVCL